jgi:GT2 family glycosyltransferase
MSIDVSEPFSGAVTYDKILWIDSDITFTPDDVIKAYKSEFDIVTGAYLLATGEAMVYTETFGKPLTYLEVNDLTEPIQLKGAGMGFMCVKSGVFESMPRPWFKTVEAEANMGDGPFMMQITGEDLSFCTRAIDLGFEIWLDPTIKLIHNKMMRLTWDGPMS